MSSGTSSPRKRELWIPSAYALAATALVFAMILGSRPGGRLPVVIYKSGSLYLGLGAALVALAGLLVSFLRRPLLQPGRMGGFLAAVGTLWAASYLLAYPSSHEGHPSRVEIASPFQDQRIVRWGGRERARNRLMLDPSKCFGITFEPGADPEETSSMVLAPAAGVVVSNTAGTLVLDLGGGEYLVLEGLGPAGTGPEEGTRVDPGTPVGREGGTGITLYLEDLPEPGRGEGIPMHFVGTGPGGEAFPPGGPQQGQLVLPRPLSESGAGKGRS